MNQENAPAEVERCFCFLLLVIVCQFSPKKNSNPWKPELVVVTVFRQPHRFLGDFSFSITCLFRERAFLAAFRMGATMADSLSSLRRRVVDTAPCRAASLRRLSTSRCNAQRMFGLLISIHLILSVKIPQSCRIIFNKKNLIGFTSKSNYGKRFLWYTRMYMYM